MSHSTWLFDTSGAEARIARTIAESSISMCGGIKWPDELLAPRKAQPLVSGLFPPARNIEAGGARWQVNQE